MDKIGYGALGLLVSLLLSGCDLAGGLSRTIRVASVPSPESTKAALESVPGIQITHREEFVGNGTRDRPDLYQFEFERSRDGVLEHGHVSMYRNLYGKGPTILLSSLYFGDLSVPGSQAKRDRSLLNDVYKALLRVDPELPALNKVTEKAIRIDETR